MLPIIAAIAIAGTAGMSMVKPSSLDTQEYAYSVQLTVSTSKAIKQCKVSKPNIEDVLDLSQTLVEYETHLTKSEHKLYAAKEMEFLAKQFIDAKEPSVRYCQHKLSEIQSVSRTLSRSMGGLHVVDVCDADFAERFKLYEQSYKDQLITLVEFQELTEDIRHIAKTDRAACSIENSVKLDQAMKLINTASSIVGSF